MIPSPPTNHPRKGTNGREAPRKDKSGHLEKDSIEEIDRERI